MKAIIFLPGLGISSSNQPVEAIGYRIKKAIDINDNEPSKKFGIDVRKEKFGNDDSLESTVVRISELNSNTKLLDVYEFSYAKELTERYDQQNLISKTFTLLLAILGNTRKIFNGIVSGKGLSANHKIQTVYVILILIAMTISGMLLVTSLPIYLAETIKLDDNPYVKTFLYEYDLGICLRENFSWLTDHLNFYVGLMAAFFLLFPNFKNYITNIATEFICLINYFNYGQQHLSLMGKFDELLEFISESNENYDEVIVVAYSFGSAVALDALFPPTRLCSVRIRQKIKTFITIGCPYDFIRVYWPKYYSNRINCCESLTNWFNVSSPIDVLSSNFRNDSALKDGDESQMQGFPRLPTNIFYSIIPHLKLTVFSSLVLLGLRSHRMYWDEAKNSSSCFTNLIQSMKENGYTLI